MEKDNKFTIRIESILGGHSPTTHFAAPNQFRASIGIDPAQPINDSFRSSLGTVATGLLRPAANEKISATTLNHAPLWMIANPKDALIYVYDYVGSIYTITLNSSTVTGLSDLNDGGSANGNGAEYYDNYIYFARNTTIARYGPLNGTPAFTDDYWVTTLSKTALTNTQYPSEYFNTLAYPNHVMHRHSDGKLYIADVVGNQGYIHYIQTTKTTVEGDTDNGSTYQKLAFGYGLLPIAIESYGSNLVIALVENQSASTYHGRVRAKLAFWDTTSTNFNQITWVEFPDDLITGLKNVNGVLYVASGNIQSDGFRISRFVGGYTFEEVAYIEDGEPPFQGAMDGGSKNLVFGSFAAVPESSGSVYSLGLHKNNLSNGIFSVMGSSSTAVAITALTMEFNEDFSFTAPIIGWSDGLSGGTHNGIDRQGSTYSNSASVFWSQMFRIGQPFKITKIRIPLAQAIAANMTVTPKIYTDDGAGTTYTLTAINNTNDSGKFNAVRRSGASGEVITGQHNFWLELRWTGSALCTVGLPITIEAELIDD